jgi:hypothetical protein
MYAVPSLELVTVYGQVANTFKREGAVREAAIIVILCTK